MNLSAKPISSPGRPDKYPPPLMRFLKSNGASKSRGKSRSSPMFIRNKKNNNNVVQEPTSPKVTCIGQVRSKARTGRPKPRLNRPCSCFTRLKRVKNRKPLFFCNKFGKRLRPRWVKPDWSKWVRFFRSGCCRKSKILADSAKTETEAEEEEDIETENVESGEDLVSMCPPKNALLLTRCRSAPYRSSSQISRFCPISETGDETEKKTEEKTEDFEEKRENGEKTEKPISETGELGQIEKKLVDLRLIEEIISRKSEEVARIKVEPIMLLRCKSEPAKTGERLNPISLDI